MGEIFEIITATDKDESHEIGVHLGIRLKIEGLETICPISGICNSYEALEMEVESIKNSLESILNKAKGIFKGATVQETLDLESDMGPEKIWEILSKIADEGLFIDNFNGLDEAKRKEVAEHVLTRCNIFTGKASVFSALYNNGSGLLG